MEREPEGWVVRCELRKGEMQGWIMGGKEEWVDKGM